MRRLKTYRAESGYVYEYVYEGRRKGLRKTEFVFLAAADGKRWAPVSVVLPEAALDRWEQSHRRRLSPTERYAIAKMALFQAFDEQPRLNAEVLVRNAEVEEIVERLEL